MELTLRVLVLMLIALVVVVAIFGAATGIISKAGETVTGSGSNHSSTLGCILSNPGNSVDECSGTSVNSFNRRRYAA
ncbi:MAG: hypothetical protein ABEJ98_05910 [Candidatus Nanohaloarchaea archaeon]